jgi:hypothetical protein
VVFGEDVEGAWPESLRRCAPHQYKTIETRSDGVAPAANVAG